MVVNVFSLPMALENLPIAADGLPLVPIGSDIRKVKDHKDCMINDIFPSAVGLYMKLGSG